jgi:hypothetical protein
MLSAGDIYVHGFSSSAYNSEREGVFFDIFSLAGEIFAHLRKISIKI